MILRSAFLLACGAALLTACSNETPAEETEQEADRDAKGDVIGGTISDDMIPLDRLRSQSPPVRECSLVAPRLLRLREVEILVEQTALRPPATCVGR